MGTLSNKMHRAVLSFVTINPTYLESSRWALFPGLLCLMRPMYGQRTASVSSLWSQATRVLGALGCDLQDSTPSGLSQKQFGTGRIKYMVFGTLPCGPADWAS